MSRDSVLTNFEFGDILTRTIHNKHFKHCGACPDLS